MNKKQKEKFINIILLLIVFVLIISNLILFIKFKDKDETEKIQAKETQNIVENTTQVKEETTEEADVTVMSEQQRMKYYMNEFLSKIENEAYNEAYNYLNQEFKDTYFKTLDEFKTYAEKNFNMTTMAIEFNNIERLGNPITGNIYVLWVNLVDVLKNTTDEEKETTNFVILEKDYNQFELSFNVK